MKRPILYRITGIASGLMALGALGLAGLFAAEIIAHPNRFWSDELALLSCFLSAGAVVGFFVASTFRRWWTPTESQMLDQLIEAPAPKPLARWQKLLGVLSALAALGLVLLDALIVADAYLRASRHTYNGATVQESLPTEVIVLATSVLIGSVCIAHYSIGTMRSARKRSTSS